MPFSPSQRLRQREYMDEVSADPEFLRQGLQSIRWLNNVLGYTWATLHHLEGFSRRWEPGQRVRILDLAAGSADVPRAIARWATKRGHDVRIVAVDRHPLTCRLAAELTHDGRITIVQADVDRLPFAPRSFDCVICSMFLHHLDDGQIVRLLRKMDQLARQGVIVSDLLRHRRAYFWITLLTTFAHPHLKHDARASVAQSLTKREVLALRDEAGLGYLRYYRHFAHRFVLAGERPQ
jgi:SAM-dependent methyltransferase